MPDGCGCYRHEWVNCHRRNWPGLQTISIEAKTKVLLVEISSEYKEDLISCGSSRGNKDKTGNGLWKVANLMEHWSGILQKICIVKKTALTCKWGIQKTYGQFSYGRLVWQSDMEKAMTGPCNMMEIWSSFLLKVYSTFGGHSVEVCLV